MDPHEANVYGRQALGLLTRARDVLCAKYDVPLTEQIHHEVVARYAQPYLSL